MNVGLNPGPRARTVKPGPRHLRPRPDPGQNRLGPHKGIPSGEARQCTPAGTEAVISALALTAPPPIKAAQNSTTVDTRSKTVALCTRGECTSSPQPRKGTRFRRDISSQGPGHTDRQAPTPCSMQMPQGVTPQQMHTSQGLHPRAKAPYWPPPRHSNIY